jgi:hypothetical protein
MRTCCLAPFVTSLTGVGVVTNASEFKDGGGETNNGAWCWRNDFVARPPGPLALSFMLVLVVAGVFIVACNDCLRRFRNNLKLYKTNE